MRNVRFQGEMLKISSFKRLILKVFESGGQNLENLGLKMIGNS